MKKFKKPYAIVENGETKFVLWNGKRTKPIHAFYEFDNILGGYTILNDKGEEIEFMDCVGNFTEKPTNFAKAFNKYINSTGTGISYGFPICDVYFTSLVDFPSKYLINQRIRKIVKNEENYKIKRSLAMGEFSNLLELVRYKHYVRSTYRKKILKADALIKYVKIRNKTEELYFDM